MNIDYDRLFCFVDDFYKGFEPWYKKSLLTVVKKKRNRGRKMSLSEIITILIAFHQSGMTCFKYFYLELMRNYKNLFNYCKHEIEPFTKCKANLMIFKAGTWECLIFVI